MVNGDYFGDSTSSEGKTKTGYHPKGCLYAAEEERKKRILKDKSSLPLSPCDEHVLNEDNNLERLIQEKKSKLK